MNLLWKKILKKAPLIRHENQVSHGRKNWDFLLGSSYSLPNQLEPKKFLLQFVLGWSIISSRLPVLPKHFHNMLPINTAPIDFLRF